MLSDVCREFAFGLSHVVHLMNPTVIILGGGLSNLGEPLRGGVESALGQAIMEVLRPGLASAWPSSPRMPYRLVRCIWL